MSFTPGPYLVVDRTDRRFAVKIVAPQIAERANPEPVVATVHTPRSWAEARATAELLAQAPLLHELLQETFVPGWERDNDWVSRASAILSRIGGLR